MLYFTPLCCSNFPADDTAVKERKRKKKKAKVAVPEATPSKFIVFSCEEHRFDSMRSRELGCSLSPAESACRQRRRAHFVSYKGPANSPSDTLVVKDKKKTDKKKQRAKTPADPTGMVSAFPSPMWIRSSICADDFSDIFAFLRAQRGLASEAPPVAPEPSAAHSAVVPLLTGKKKRKRAESTSAGAGGKLPTTNNATGTEPEKPTKKNKGKETEDTAAINGAIEPTVPSKSCKDTVKSYTTNETSSHKPLAAVTSSVENAAQTKAADVEVPVKKKRGRPPKAKQAPETEPAVTAPIGPSTSQADPALPSAPVLATVETATPAAKKRGRPHKKKPVMDDVLALAVPVVPTPASPSQHDAHALASSSFVPQAKSQRALQSAAKEKSVVSAQDTANERPTMLPLPLLQVPSSPSFDFELPKEMAAILHTTDDTNSPSRPVASTSSTVKHSVLAPGPVSPLRLDPVAISNDPTVTTAADSTPLLSPETDTVSPTVSRSVLHQRICPLCGKTPLHVPAKCGIVTGGLPGLVAQIAHVRDQLAQAETGGKKAEDIRTLKKRLGELEKWRGIKEAEKGKGKAVEVASASQQSSTGRGPAAKTLLGKSEIEDSEDDSTEKNQPAIAPVLALIPGRHPLPTQHTSNVTQAASSSSSASDSDSTSDELPRKSPTVKQSSQAQSQRRSQHGVAASQFDIAALMRGPTRPSLGRPSLLIPAEDEEDVEDESSSKKGQLSDNEEEDEEELERKRKKSARRLSSMSQSRHGWRRDDSSEGSDGPDDQADSPPPARSDSGQNTGLSPGDPDAAQQPTLSSSVNPTSSSLSHSIMAPSSIMPDAPGDRSFKELQRAGTSLLPSLVVQPSVPRVSPSGSDDSEIEHRTSSESSVTRVSRSSVSGKTLPVRLLTPPPRPAPSQGDEDQAGDGTADSPIESFGPTTPKAKSTFTAGQSKKQLVVELTATPRTLRTYAKKNRTPRPEKPEQDNEYHHEADGEDEEGGEDEEDEKVQPQKATRKSTARPLVSNQAAARDNGSDEEEKEEEEKREEVRPRRGRPRAQSVPATPNSPSSAQSSKPASTRGRPRAQSITPDGASTKGGKLASAALLKKQQAAEERERKKAAKAEEAKRKAEEKEQKRLAAEMEKARKQAEKERKLLEKEMAAKANVGTAASRRQKRTAVQLKAVPTSIEVPGSLTPSPEPEAQVGSQSPVSLPGVAVLEASPRPQVAQSHPESMVDQLDPSSPEPSDDDIGPPPTQKSPMISSMDEAGEVDASLQIDDDVSKGATSSSTINTSTMSSPSRPTTNRSAPPMFASQRPSLARRRDARGFSSLSLLSLAPANPTVAQPVRPKPKPSRPSQVEALMAHETESDAESDSDSDDAGAAKRKKAAVAESGPHASVPAKGRMAGSLLSGYGRTRLSTAGR